MRFGAAAWNPASGSGKGPMSPVDTTQWGFLLAGRDDLARGCFNNRLHTEQVRYPYFGYAASAREIRDGNPVSHFQA